MGHCGDAARGCRRAPGCGPPSRYPCQCQLIAVGVPPGATRRDAPPCPWSTLCSPGAGDICFAQRGHYHALVWAPSCGLGGDAPWVAPCQGLARSMRAALARRRCTFPSGPCRQALALLCTGDALFLLSMLVGGALHSDTPSLPTHPLPPSPACRTCTVYCEPRVSPCCISSPGGPSKFQGWIQSVVMMRPQVVRTSMQVLLKVLGLCPWRSPWKALVA